MLHEWIITEETEQEKQDDNDSDDDDDNFPKGGKAPSKQIDTDSESEQPKNKGKLIMDATCAPADIAYPTDLGLLNEAREKLEHIIDVLHEPYRGKRKKPRTYRQKARKNYLSVAKQRKPRGKAIRNAVRKQLGYVARDLKIISELELKKSLHLYSA